MYPKIRVALGACVSIDNDFSLTEITLYLFYLLIFNKEVLAKFRINFIYLRWFWIIVGDIQTIKRLDKQLNNNWYIFVNFIMLTKTSIK